MPDKCIDNGHHPRPKPAIEPFNMRKLPSDKRGIPVHTPHGIFRSILAASKFYGVADWCITYQCLKYDANAGSAFFFI